MPVMFFVYLHTYLHVFTWYLSTFGNTRVGANCNSPFHMGEFGMWTIWNMGEFATKANCNMGELQFAPTTHAKNLMPISMFNDQWLMFTDPCSLTSAHSSLFTLHFSLFTFHWPLPSYFYSHFSQRFFLICTSKMLYFCIEFKTGLRR